MPSVRVRFRALTTPRLKKNADQIKKDVVNVLLDVGDSIIEDIREYPPQPEASKYKRTFTLYHGWSRMVYTRSDGSLVCLVFNDATDQWGRKYAGWVQGAMQAHQNAHWTRIGDILDDYKDSLRDSLRNVYSSIQ